MKARTVLAYEFVETLPRELREGTIYISIPFATAGHKCCCGCGQEVITPLSPTDWSLIFDGETVSLVPSIGNWSLPCQSHYWITRNQVRWARRWSQKKIQHNRERTRLAKALLWGSRIDEEGYSKHTKNKELGEKDDGKY